ncbi:MAG: 50S ribosomal protein L4 [Planctomycetaceae bacterium]|jgi:large subunit ribosomal protein L4|nr:50S ribosomal protein L4 [Planctomycetaceae bacterium]
MPKLNVHDVKGKKVGTYNIEVTDLAPRINKQLLHDAVVMYQSNLRQGSHKTKNRHEVSGSTKKMYRQKGTGNARAGHRKSGIRRGGGHMKQIHPRDYSYSLPRKALQLATRMALASKVRDDEIVLIDKLEFAAPKTKEMAGILKTLGCEGQSVLVATSGYDVNVYKSGRNIDRVNVAPASDLNAHSVLTAKRVLMTTAALDAFKTKAASSAKATAN